MEPGAVFPKVGRPERKADHSPPFNVKVKNEFTHTCTHFHMPSLRVLWQLYIHRAWGVDFKLHVWSEAKSPLTGPRTLIVKNLFKGHALSLSSFMSFKQTAIL